MLKLKDMKMYFLLLYLQSIVYRDLGSITTSRQFQITAILSVSESRSLYDIFMLTVAVETNGVVLI